MFETFVAYLLNKCVGKYVHDFDSEKLNVGIFSGTVQLTDLQLKSEALFELNLPIEVVKGTVGKVSIDIPWTTLYSDPILVHLEDILILASPITEHQYDADLEKRLIRARKQKILEDVKRNQPFHTLFDNVAVKSKGFFENLLATIVNNVQISIQNVHIRYEDTVARNDGYAICCGIAFQCLTAITTNHKWKPTQIDSNSPNIFKLIKLETFYAYFNPRVDQQRLAKNDIKSIHWTSLMKTSIFNCSLCEEEFEFVLKPIIAKVKLIFNKSKEQRVPKLLVDCVLQDTAIEISQSQYISILRVTDNFMRIEINRKYVKYKPIKVVLKSKPGLRALWKYAYKAIVEEYVRPYSWSRIKTHRNNYRKYKLLYKQRLLKPADAELKVDLQIAEDSLDICNILIAQEDAKLEIAEEEPRCVELVTDTIDGGSNMLNSWWMSWLGLDFSKIHRRTPVISIKSEKENLWSKFTNEEKEKVNEMMQSFGETSPTQETNVDIDKYIAHKINVTLANITVSLINGTHNGDRKEILVASLNHLLASFETRPSANGYKLSVRAETFIVEGVAGGSSHYEIIPIITADKSVTTSVNIKSNLNTNHRTHMFAIDFERNPLNVKANYSITGEVEPIEVLYQHQSYIEAMRFFFDVPLFDAFTKNNELKTMVRDTIERTSRLSKKRIIEYVFEKQSLIYWNVDLKSPYFVIPEYGAIERSGRVLVVDFGRLLIKSDLQQKSAIFDKTNATASEMEEKLYDRISITLSDVQILFSDTGDEWRIAKELPESDVHLMPRLHVHFVCSRSLRPDYLMAPKYKLNVIVAALKFNLSDRRIRLLSDFILKVPLPIFKESIVHETDSVESKLNIVVPLFDMDAKWIQRDLKAMELSEIRFILSAVPVKTEEAGDSQCMLHPSSVDTVVDTCSISQKTPNNEDDEYYSASDVSEYDDSELVSWVRTIDLPGFEDNVSPSNVIAVMVRFTVGEVLLQLSRSSDVCDKPYLMLRIEKLNIDLSLMTYGPALQASLRRIQLVDKQQSSLTGGYLELLNSTSESEMITILYRKVKATCPDFKTHFHQVEHSLIIDLNALSVTFHRESLITMARYITYVIDSIPIQLLTRIKSEMSSIIPESPSALILVRKQSDPPIPAGATKCSFSTRFSRIDIHLCETELNLAKIEITGFEFDYIQKANEKYVIRVDLSQLNVFDETEDTLYQKIFYMENDEKIFDFKYTRKSPLLIENSNLTNKTGETNNESESTCDGSLRLRFGHIQFVFLLKFIINFYHFLTPFMPLQNFRNNLRKTATKNIQESVNKVADRKTRLKLNINIKSPTVIIPQKANSPNVIVCNLGDLTIENFFSNMKIESQPNALQLTDNMLMRLNGFHVLRRNMQIATDGSIVMDRTENNSFILQPINIRLDLKQALWPRVSSIEVIPIYISAEVDSLKLNISETDLSICFSIYQENFEEGLQRLKSCGDNSARISPNLISPQTPELNVLNVNQNQDDSALVYFLSNTAEGFKDKCVRFTLEGVEIVFVTTSTQTTHTLSPLCRFTFDDISLFLCLFLDKSYEAKFSLHSLLLEDLRKESMSYVKTIFQPFNPSSHPSVDPRFSIKTPPVFDLTYKGSPNDGHVDVMIERTRFNLSLPFMSAIFNFIRDSTPLNITTDTVDIPVAGLMTDQFKKLGYKKRLPSDMTSGFHSTTTYDFDTTTKYAFSVSAVLKRMEIILYANPTDINSRLLVLRYDSIYDYSRNAGCTHNVLSLIGIQLMSCLNGKRSDTASMVLYPMDVELSRNSKNNDEVAVDIRLSDIDVRLSSPIVCVFIDLTKEVMHYFRVKKETINGGNKEYMVSPLLWQQKRIYVEKWMNYFALNHLLTEQKTAIFKPHFLVETINVNPFEVKFYFEVYSRQKLVPILYAKLAMDANVKNWSKDIAMQANCQFDVMYFNRNLSVWEPLLEPVIEVENKYRPLELNLKLFTDVAYPVSFVQNCRFDGESLPLDTLDTGVKDEGSIEGTHSKIISVDNASTDESDIDSETIIIKPKRSSQNVVKKSPSVKLCESVKSLPVVIESSDSETEEGVFGKIASAFGHLISDQSSEDERDNDLIGSDLEGSVEDAVAVDNITEQLNTGGTESTDSDLATEHINGKEVTDFSPKGDDTASIFCVVIVKDKIDINITPVALENIEDFVSVIKNPKKLSVIEQSILKGHFDDADVGEDDTQIFNFLGPEGVVKILQKNYESDGLHYSCRLESSGRDFCPSNAPRPSKIWNMSSKQRSDFDDILVEVDSKKSGDTNVCFDDAIDGCFQSKPSASERLSLNSCDLRSHHFEPDLNSLYEKHSRERLSIEISGFNKLQLPLPRNSMKAIYPLQQEKGTDKGVQSRIRYFIVIDVDMRYGLKVITVSSPLVVENNLGRPVLLLCLKDSLQRIGAAVDDYARNPFHEKYVQLAMLETDCKFNVSLLVAYHCQLFLQPVTLIPEEPSFELSAEGLWWQEIVKSVTSGSTKRCKFIKCPSSEKTKPDFWIKVIPKQNKEIKASSTGIRTVPNLTLHLYPPLVIHNALCYPLHLISKSNVNDGSLTEPVVLLSEGESVSFFNIDPKNDYEFVVELQNYLGCLWKGRLCLNYEQEDEFKKIPMTRFSTEKSLGDTEEFVNNKYSHLTICVHYMSIDEEALHLYLYSPYWIINKTGLNLQIRGSRSDIIYESFSENEPVLFKLQRRKPKKAKFQLNDTNWSSGIPMDTIGNKGVVVIRDNVRRRKYRFFVDVKLSKYCFLTKIIIVKPYFVIHNSTRYQLSFMEESEEKDLWFDISSKSFIPFFPESDSMKMYIKEKDSKISSHHFPINYQHRSVLRMDSLQALTVTVNVFEDDSTIIRIDNYSKEDIVVRVENYCEDLFFKIHQKQLGQVTLLSPFQSVKYTWDDPCAERVLMWNLYNRKASGFVAQIERDGFGQELVSFQTIKQYSVSSKRRQSSKKSPTRTNVGRQRSLPNRAASSDSDESDVEHHEQLPKRKLRKDKVAVYWVSFIDPEDNQRVLLFTQDERIAVEARKNIAGQLAKWELFLALNSGFGVSIINRKFQEVAYISSVCMPAIWEIEMSHKWKPLNVELSAWLEDQWTHGANVTQLKTYIEVDLTPSKMVLTKPFFGKLRRTFNPCISLQVRKSMNQIYFNAKLYRLQIDNQLPNAVFPVVFHPKAQSKLGMLKPFIDLSLFLFHDTKKSSNNEVFIVKYCKALIQEFKLNIDNGFVQSINEFRRQCFPKKSSEDTSVIAEDLKYISKPIYVESEESMKTFLIEYLHVSPIKFEVSFTVRNSMKAFGISLKHDLLEFLIHAVGAPLTDFKDVKLSFVYFEVVNTPMNIKRLLSSVNSHFRLQLLRQFYVFILGLDVLGNQLGLLRDFTDGVSDRCYEPVDSQIVAPDKFANSVSEAISQLIGNVIYCTSQSIASISGTFPNVDVSQVFDEYVTKEKRRQPRFETQTNTIGDILSQASKGFAFGVVLGISGIFSKPVVGAYEEGVEGFFKGLGKGLFGLISKPGASVFDIVGLTCDGIRRLMETDDNIVMQSRLPRFVNPLMGLCNYSAYEAKGYRIVRNLNRNDDVYWCHVPVTKFDRGDVVLVTLSNICLLSNCRFWGGFDVEWIVNVEDLVSIPLVNNNSLLLKIGQFPDSVIEYRIDFETDPLVVKWLKNKIEELMLFNMCDKSCVNCV